MELFCKYTQIHILYYILLLSHYTSDVSFCSFIQASNYGLDRTHEVSNSLILMF